jgi:general secretion pathway protein G
MVQATKIGNFSARENNSAGFTLMELIVVLLLVALLASIVTPIVTKSILRAKEATLKEDLLIMRKAIDDYYADTDTYPESLEVLVEKRYLRKMPKDPITEKTDTWVFDDSNSGVGGIYDVHSGSDKLSSEETPYSEW